MYKVSHLDHNKKSKKKIFIFKSMYTFELLFQQIFIFWVLILDTLYKYSIYYTYLYFKVPFPKWFIGCFFFLAAAAAAAAAASSSKEKSWNTLGNVGNASQRNKKQNKQMPVRPRSVNSTFEKRGSKPPLGYATLNNDRTSNRSFQENGSYGSRYVLLYSNFNITNFDIMN